MQRCLISITQLQFIGVTFQRQRWNEMSRTRLQVCRFLLFSRCFGLVHIPSWHLCMTKRYSKTCKTAGNNHCFVPQWKNSLFKLHSQNCPAAMDRCACYKDLNVKITGFKLFHNTLVCFDMEWTQSTTRLQELWRGEGFLSHSARQD